MFGVLEGEGEDPRKQREENRPPVDYRLVRAFRKQVGDSGQDVASFATGVRVGVGVQLLRVTAMYPSQGRWRLTEQERSSAASRSGDRELCVSSRT